LNQSHEDDPYFTSRYSADSNSSPLYPFGHGLSYTQFSFANLAVKEVAEKDSKSLSVSVDVSNTGKVSGDEVAQVYIHQRSGSAARPARELKGFQRVTLIPGETRTLHFTIPFSDLHYWDPQTRTWILEPATFDLWVGGDSKAILHAELTIKG
jgi:beta-glucosidase